MDSWRLYGAACPPLAALGLRQHRVSPPTHPTLRWACVNTEFRRRPTQRCADANAEFRR
ncbi:hypothetical protein [Mixta calida]|uniref:hypothetical protein n=1 Tax=Mixta calida TaxID=665913 RepID=UPI000AA7BE0E